MKKNISIIIPALNEKATITDVITECRTVLDAEQFSTSVIVVDDGSTDSTAIDAANAGAIVVSHNTNRGVGRAFRTGVEAALSNSADIIVNIDADGQFNPNDIETLITPIIEKSADFVTASRFKDLSLLPDMPAVKIWGNRMMSIIISQITGKRFYDVSCGFRAYSREAALRLNLWGDFTYTQESFIDLRIKGMRVEEIPLKIRGEREHGKSRVASNLFKYGYRSANIILHSYRDYWPLKFFGFLSLICMIPGITLILFLLGHRITSGSFTPHIWAGFTGGAMLASGIMIFIVGLIGEMLKRIRLNQETLLYYQRVQSLTSDPENRLS